MKSALLVLLAVVLLQCFLEVESHRVRVWTRRCFTVLVLSVSS